MKLKLQGIACTGVVAMLMMTNVAEAQVFNSAPRYWDAENPLSLDEFPTMRARRDSVVSQISCSMRYLPEEKTIDGIKYKYFKFASALQLDDCGVVESCKSESVRLYNQTIFDITELYARIGTNELLSNSEMGYDEIYEYFNRRAKNRVGDFVEESRRGRDTLVVQREHEAVERDLARAKVDPKYSFLMKQPTWGIGYHLGFDAMFPQCDCFSNSFGVSFGLEFLAKNNMFLGLNMNCAAGVFKRDVLLDEKLVEKGDPLCMFSFEGVFGYPLCEGKVVRIVPMVGLGLMECEKSAEEKKNRVFEDAFAYSVGCDVDFILKRNRYLARDVMMGSNRPYSSRRSSELQTIVKLRPMVYWAKFSGMSRNPYYGVSISFAQMQRMYK